MENTETRSENRRSRQHVGVRMGPGFRAAVAKMHDEDEMYYADIAVKLGFADGSALTRILSGNRGVSMERANFIADVLGKPLEELRETSR